MTRRAIIMIYTHGRRSADGISRAVIFGITFSQTGMTSSMQFYCLQNVWNDINFEKFLAGNVVRFLKVYTFFSLLVYPANPSVWFTADKFQRVVYNRETHNTSFSVKNQSAVFNPQSETSRLTSYGLVKNRRKINVRRTQVGGIRR